MADERRIAADPKFGPNRWSGHAEKVMPLLARPRFAWTYSRCGELVKYVSEIQCRYESYSNLIALD